MRSPQEELASVVYRSYADGAQLLTLSSPQRKKLIKTIAEVALKQKDQVLEANTLDLVASREMAVPEVVWEWSKLTPERWQQVINLVEQLAELPDPLSGEQQGAVRRVPLGMIAFVYEGFSQLALLSAAMCLKTANSVLIKGGTESSHTQMAIIKVLRYALQQQGLSEYIVTTTPSGCGIKELLSQDKYIRLLIPYGRPSFVQQLCKQATVSILPTAIGNCYMYVAPSGSLERARELILASRQHQPDPITAIEKVVLHSHWLEQDAGKTFIEWVRTLQNSGLEVRGCEITTAQWRQYHSPNGDELASESNWGQAFLDHSLAIKIVDSTAEAISWINQYSSGHADCALTDSVSEAHQIINRLNSSTITINNYYEFHRGGRGTNRVLLGMSSIKTRGAYCHTGVIDLNTFTANKFITTYAL